MEFSWPMVSAISTIITIIGIVALLWLRTQMANYFTPNAAFAALAQKVSAIETDMRTAPTQRDLQSLSDRVQKVEVGVAVVQETVVAMKESMSRIDRGVDRIEKHLLENNK